MKKFTKLLVFLLMVGVLSGCAEEAVEEEIELYTYKEADYAGTEFKMESDDLLFELDKATTQFTVTKKSTGKVWSSNPVDAATDTLADAASKRLLQSTLIMEYSNVSELAVVLNTFEHSIGIEHASGKGIYSIEQPDANTIKVNYSLGKVARTFVIPPSVPDARMMEWYDKLDRSMQKKVENYYRKIDINSLLPTDDKAALLEQYPDLETTCVWEMRAATKDHQKETLQEAFAAIGYTQEEYEKDLLYYPTLGGNDKPTYNISVIYRLDGDELIVEVPFDEIEYKSDYPITDLSLLPYFGAATTTDEGFMFVPEGPGALINFNNGKTNLSAYYAQLYGWDYGMKRDVVVNETRAAFPVFGISYPDGAMISIIDEYSTLATIQADVAGRRHGYNYAYASYDMVHGSKMDVSAKSDATIIAYEKKLPEGSIKQTYRFIDGNTYSDMAKAYREDLLEKYPELQKTENTNAPISIELIAAIDRVKQVVGMPVTLPEVLTSFEDAQNILKDFMADGYANASLRYTGWLNGGIKHSIPKDIDITSGMGGKKGLEALISLAESLNTDLYLNGHTQNAYDSSLTDGFFKSRDVAKYISREVVEIPEFSRIWFADINESRLEHHFLLRPSVSVTLMQSLADYAKGYNVGVGFEDAGRLLSGDYNQKRSVTREATMKMQTETLAGIKANGTKVTMTAGNEYALPYADLLTEVDLFGHDSLILDEKVPFYEIAMHGLVDYTGNAVNLSGDAWGTVLKSAETGAGLSFTFYAEPTSLVQGTEYMDFFGANYDGWKEKAKEYATRYEKDMAGLNNQYITEHRILADGVTATVYEDSTVVYVNTTEFEYSDETVTIPAREYLVERSER
ncbi:MAG: hypothetical protein IJZ55_06010 [Lachnospiraceae bacterium]|nr:hypothetical protein [Lachnospiraceae bacterium]